MIQNQFKNYPKTDGHSAMYVRYPVIITQEIIDLKATLFPLTLGKYMAVNVLQDGYSINPAPVQFDTEEECQKGCNAHNKWAGYTVQESIQIVYQSMQNSNEFYKQLNQKLQIS